METATLIPLGEGQVSLLVGQLEFQESSPAYFFHSEPPPTSILILLGDRLGSEEEKPRILSERRTRQDSRGQMPEILSECRTRQVTRAQKPTVTQPLFVKRL